MDAAASQDSSIGDQIQVSCRVVKVKPVMISDGKMCRLLMTDLDYDNIRNPLCHSRLYLSVVMPRGLGESCWVMETSDEPSVVNHRCRLGIKLGSSSLGAVAGITATTLRHISATKSTITS